MRDDDTAIKKTNPGLAMMAGDDNIYIIADDTPDDWLKAAAGRDAADD